MASPKATGKKRAFEDQSLTDADIGSPKPSERKVKKAKRAEIRKCPVCEDDIPVRLLASHEEFELQRVEEICRARVENEDLVPWEQIEADVMGAGPSRRGAAVRARRSMNATPSSQSQPGVNPRKSDLLAQVSKTVKLVQRHRRERHIKLKELSKAELESENNAQRWGLQTNRLCPVCQTTVSGDPDVVEAHVDSCLAHAVTSATANGADLEADGLEEYEAGGETRIRIARSVDFRGAGFDVRNPLHDDVDDEIDVDGDDAAAFGDVQFTERDIIVPGNNTEDEDVRVDSDAEDDVPPTQHDRVGTSLRDLVAQGKVVIKADGDGVATSGVVSTDSAGLGGLMCRICLDAYSEPTVSTGCWHTCCRECWLRCLGTTKLCPICKRITAAGDLRRIYL